MACSISACSSGETSHGADAARSAACGGGSPQQVADTWLRERLRLGARHVSLDTLHLREADSSRHVDSATNLGDQYAAYFRAFYGDEARHITPVWRWQQTPSVEAFMLTVPSEMYGTATAIWTYSDSTCSWSREAMASDLGGDGGEHYRLDSWLVDLDGDGERDLVQRTKNWGESDEGKAFLKDRFRVFYWRNTYFAET